ncbi:MAG: asparagine synthase-related protein [Bryobacteraceae bacterium]
MISSIRSRGPDDVACVGGQGFHLGFCRLAIVDPESGVQPCSANGVSVVFNGELYNYPSIKRKLWQEYGISVHSEVQALLHLYELFGLAFSKHLDGDFAIAVIDLRIQRCHLIRDFRGVKPLFYAQLSGGKTWAFASHIKALFQCSELSTGLDFVALAEKRVLSFWSSDRTFFERIHQLLPGHSLSLPICSQDCGRTPSPELRPLLKPESSLVNDFSDREDIGNRCASVIASALAKRLEHSEVTPVILALSGGVDSSLLAALAADRSPETLSTMTIHDGFETEDLDCATDLAKALRLSHRCFLVTAQEFFDSYPRMVAECASPNQGYSAFFLGRAMRELYPGAKVLLMGEGADELFVGYSLLMEHQRYRAKSLRALYDRGRDRIAESPLLQRVILWETAKPGDVWLDLIEMFQHEQLVNLHLVPFDHGPMAHSIECRVPYLGDEVIEFIQDIPAEARVLRGCTKILLRLALEKAIDDKPEIKHRLLSRRPSPAFFSTQHPSRCLKELLNREISGSKLETSDLRPFARDIENLFWMAGTATIFLKYRGEVNGLSFADFKDEVLHAPVV